MSTLSPRLMPSTQQPALPAQRRNLAEEVTRRLRHAIVSGEIRPGTPLAEPVLAERFGASRAPIREALIALERDGLVEFNDRNRTRVRSLTVQDFQEICSMRVALESLAARLAAERWTEADTRKVEENLRRQEVAATLGGLSRLDVEMHELIVVFSGNRRLIAAWAGIRWQFEMCLAYTHRLQEKLAFEPRRITVESHRRLLASLASGKAEVAAQTMAAHIEGSLEWSLAKFPPSATEAQSEIALAGKRRLATKAVKAALVAILSFANARAAEIAPQDLAFFESKIRPLLVEHCYDCHSGEKTKGGLALDTRAGWQKGGDSGAALVPGKPDDSLLIKAVRYEDEDFAMPPKKKGGKLSAADIAVLTEWVRMGAPDPREAVAKLGGMKAEDAKKWWAFQPLPNPDAAPSAKKIDAFIDDKLVARSLLPNPPADKRTLIRRATYDLIGLPPTPQEVEAFVADASPDAFAKLVERLLASPQYGVQWGRHWLDVVRYADTAGENTDRPLVHAWRYRNWVMEAFNRDLPYDHFVRLQLAGDILNADRPDPERNEGIVATGYLAIARRFGHDIDKDIHLTHEDAIDNLGKNFLGLTTGCARCHDHKYDPITAQDYYALYGILSSTRFAFPGCEPKGQPRDMVPLMPKEQAEAILKPWRERAAKVEAEKKRRAELEKVAKKAIGENSAKAVRLLAGAQVNEGKSVAFAEAARESLANIRVCKGEVLQLTVLPNASHGADTTQVEWRIEETGGAGRKWNVADVISNLTQSNPREAAAGASWCFLEVTDGPAFLAERREAISGNGALKSWSLGSEPSVFVNSADQQVMVWTTLAAESFFMHPGPKRPVAVAWVSPIDGVVAVAGRVADAHPSGSDGVAFQLNHIAAPEVGPALIQMGRALLDKAVEPEPAPAIPVAYAVAEATAKNAPMQLRGDPEKPGEEVPRRWLAVFGGEAVPLNVGSGRQQLGDWITQQPLAARVMANRIWQWHFGSGLVRSPNDFGARGDEPTHPELLDWLAAEFAASGYSVKAMHRLIMNTAAYQRSSACPDDKIQSDHDNRLLARFSRRRLSAEEIRDSLLTVSGQLDRTPAEAHPFPEETTWKFTQHNPFGAVYTTNKRSAFLMVQRQRRHPFLALFDGADPNASTPERQTTTVPTQALYFLNDPFFHEQAARFAAAAMKQPDEATRLAQAFRVGFQREPSLAEREQATHFLASYPGSPEEKWAAYARVLLASNEFIHLD